MGGRQSVGLIMRGGQVWLPAIIPRRKYRIPSALRSQAPLGWQSTVVGDDTGTASVAGLFLFSFFLFLFVLLSSDLVFGTLLLLVLSQSLSV